MNKIKQISIVCSTGAETYFVGQKVNGKMISNIERFPGSEDSAGAMFPGYFLVTEKSGNPIVEISDNTPYVVEFE